MTEATTGRPADEVVVPDAERWNHNIHISGVLLDALPPHIDRALDVGSGEGVLSRRLAARATQVLGIDLDRPSLALARAQSPDGEVAYAEADALAAPFPPASFDAVVSVAALHHMGTEAGLVALRDLVRPGGVLGVVGLARSRSPKDLAFDLAGAVSTRLHQRAKGLWETPSPKVWPPPESYGQVRRVAERVLPGAHYRRHALWRYSLVWTKPA